MFTEDSIRQPGKFLQVDHQKYDVTFEGLSSGVKNNESEF